MFAYEYFLQMTAKSNVKMLREGSWLIAIAIRVIGTKFLFLYTLWYQSQCVDIKWPLCQCSGFLIPAIHLLKFCNIWTFPIYLIFPVPVLKTNIELIYTVFDVSTFYTIGNYQYGIVFRHEPHLIMCLLVFQKKNMNLSSLILYLPE